MGRTVCRLLFLASIASASIGKADPSKPIKDAMNHRASVFDLYMHTLTHELEDAFEDERKDAQLGAFLAEIIERGGMIDRTAKAGDEFSEEFVARMKSSPAMSFSSFNYDFATNRFTLSLSEFIPPDFPIMDSDLSFDSEQKRKKFLTEETERAWKRVSYLFTLHRIQKGYDSKAFDEEAFKKEVLDTTELKVEWTIFTGNGRKETTLSKSLVEKGIDFRTYTGTRSPTGKISVDYEDFMRKEKK